MNTLLKNLKFTPGVTKTRQATQGPNPTRVLTIGLLSAALVGPASARENLFVNDAEPDAPKSVRDGEKWREQQVNPPPWPRDQDLIPVRLDNTSEPFDYFIDARSLSTGTDKVVRYTLVAESASGSRNLSFEGLRCTPRGQYRVYAYGQGSSFQPSGLGEQWLPVDRTGADPIHEELWRHYLCVPRKFEPRPHKAQLRALKNGRVGEFDNSGFMTQ
ncbi:CNP1-like family protein [Thiorhodovibrio winogradskyi]|uniref:CNP1-like family protein n=1 Tax=Thiorhodovibrio winogradskyi TaxID=77007 RepID=A0ABZ0SFM8_9GAMM|nr:CNP1-like family protein [Thiorhodovibrio winogradskyi]